mmetsp:Transcript_32887/g.82602  ORF Transcript_32887/g.82602 Transcript_32887/m.82602 type:complete len:394 (+) Transcript_32887:118-1299(+)
MFELNIITMLILGVGVLHLPLLVDLLRVLFPSAHFERLSHRWMSRLLIVVVSALLASSLYYFFGTYLPLLVCPVRRADVAAASADAAETSTSQYALTCSVISLLASATPLSVSSSSPAPSSSALPDEALWQAFLLSLFALYLWFVTTVSYYYAVSAHAGQPPALSADDVGHQSSATRRGSEREIDGEMEMASVRDVRPTSQEELRTCFRCEGAPLKPPSTRHCSTCERCVYMFDHHCPFIANCVGQDNFVSFWQFLGFLWIGVMFVCYCTLPPFLACVLGLRSPFGVQTFLWLDLTDESALSVVCQWSGSSVYLYPAAFMLSWCVGWLFVFETLLIRWRISTLDFLSRTPAYLRDPNSPAKTFERMLIQDRSWARVLLWPVRPTPWKGKPKSS